MRDDENIIEMVNQVLKISRRWMRWIFRCVKKSKIINSSGRTWSSELPNPGIYGCVGLYDVLDVNPGLRHDHRQYGDDRP